MAFETMFSDVWSFIFITIVHIYVLEIKVKQNNKIT